MDRDPQIVHANIDRFRRLLEEQPGRLDARTRATIEKLLGEEIAKQTPPAKAD